jgi:O-antigen/teichoic acid export membrane protein
VTILAITVFAGAVAIGLLAIGPSVMTLFLGDKGFHYGRVGLALVGIGMGLHLTAGTLNQALLARGRAHLAAVAWLIAAVLFVIFVATPTITSQVTRVEVGYAGAAAVLWALLFVAYRRSHAAPAPEP